jgi:AP-4 complex subunit epsilon-1
MDSLFQDRKTPRTLNQETRSLIELIGETKNKSTEEDLIRKEIVFVKTQLGARPDPEELPDILVKLVYFETLGYDTSFAHIVPINLCQSGNPYLKKLSYLLAAMLVKPGEELGMLMNNTILKDLASENAFVIMTTLTMLRYFLTQELVQNVLPVLRKLLKHPTSIIRKKAYLVLFNISQLYPDAVPDVKALAVEALQDQDTPVIFTGVSMLQGLVVGNPHLFKEQTKRLVEVLWSILDHRYPKEYDYHRIPAPWVTISVLQMLEALGRNDQGSSQLMYEVLEKEVRYCTNLSSSSPSSTQRCTSARGSCSRP